MDDIFTNRELATALWLVLFAIWALTKSGVRVAHCNLMCAFFNWKIVVPLLAMVAYMALAVGQLSAIGFWDVSAAKDTVVWVLAVASVTMFRADKGSGSFFKDAVLDNLKLIAALEFISNAYTFSLLAELLLVPFLTLLVTLKTVAKDRAKLESRYGAADAVLGAVLSVAWVALLGIAIFRVLSDLDGFVTIHNIRDFLLPAVLGGLYLPFVYAWALFLAYEILFVRIDIQNGDRRLARQLKWLVFGTFHIRLGRLHQWNQRAPNLHVSSREEATGLVRELGPAN